MRLENRRTSRNVKDQRGGGGKVAVAGGGLGLLVLIIGSQLLGVDLTQFASLLEDPNGSQSSEYQPYQGTPEEEALLEESSKVLALTEDVFGQIVPEQLGIRYREPTMTVYTNQTQTACGAGSAAMGPFYCSGDDGIYLDLSFYRTLERQLQSKGDFARAYVVAHEAAHHLQNLTGTTRAVQQAKQGRSDAQRNFLTRLQELQADCYAGVWAHHVQERFNILDGADLREALNAAFQIGDDTLAKNAGRRPVEAAFTHGTGDERQTWFVRGFKTGDLNECNTFDS